MGIIKNHYVKKRFGTYKKRARSKGNIFSKHEEQEGWAIELTLREENKMAIYDEGN